MQWLLDVRHGWRALVRAPGFLVTSVATLALAIGAVVGMFSVVNTVLLRPLPFPDPDRLVVLSGTAPGSDLPERFGLGGEFYVHYKERSQLLDGIVLFGAGTSTLRTENRVERIDMAFPTNDIYATLGMRPQIGRLPVSEDADRVAVISDRLWSTWFGRDPAVVGKTYSIAGEMRQVIGVMPPEFSFPSEATLLWVAGEIRPAEVRPGQFGAPVVARMKPGVTREQLAAELTRLSKELPARFGGSPNYARIIEQHSAVVDPVLDRLVGPTASTSLWVLLGAVTIVLLIACANVANLFLVRAVASEHRVRANALYISASALGAAVAPLLMAPVMERFGWRAVFVLSGLLGGAAGTTLLTLMPRPQRATAGAPAQTFASIVRGTQRLAADSNLRRLSLAYLLHSAVYFVFVFWFFRYLTEGRGFTVLASGLWASLPSIAGFLCAPIIGVIADRIGRRIGGSRARRRVAMACLLGATALALTGAIVPSAFLAIAALSLSSACLNGAESPFFTTATVIGAANPGASAGLLNLMGNLGGVLSIWLVPRMSAAWGWNGTLSFWAGVAFAAALLWLSVRVEEPSPDRARIAR